MTQMANHPEMRYSTNVPHHKKVWREFVQKLAAESNIYGLAKVVSASSASSRIIWVIFMLIGFAAATAHLTFLVSKYLSYETVPDSKIRYNSSLAFPSVTVCNGNPFSFGKLNKELGSSDYKSLPNWFKFLMAVNASAEVKQRLDSLQTFFENLPDVAMRISHDVDELILHCRFNNEVCFSKNFTEHFDSRNHYRCFTFNGVDLKEKINSKATGPLTGLSLIISLNGQDMPLGAYGLYDLSKPSSFGASARVHIHSPNSLPNPSDDGFDVSPGFSTSIGLTAVTNKLKSHPYGNCTNSGLGIDFKYRNTMQTCFMLCKQNTLIEKCGCQSSVFPEYQGKRNVAFCGEVTVWNTSVINGSKNRKRFKTLECENNLLHGFNLYDHCKCFPPCEEMSYQKTISISYWPLPFFQYDFLHKVRSKNNTMPYFAEKAYNIYKTIITKYNNLLQSGNYTFNQEDSEDRAAINKASDLVRQNMLRLNIYFEELNVFEFTLSGAYEIGDFLADVGGTLGLWMGISAITVMEIAELVYGLAVLLKRRDGN